jgi:hypothetical protein
MHWALEAIYEGEGYDEAHLRLDEWYKEQQDNGISASIPGEELDALYDLKELGHHMLDNYEKFEKAAKVKLGKVLAVEGQFVKGAKKFKTKTPKGYPPEIIIEAGRVKVPIVNPDTLEPLTNEEGKVAYLTGKIDLLTERKTPKKGLWIVDHKNLSSASSDRGLDFDDQVTGYCYIVWRWTGQIPRGVIYNNLIKQEVKEPRYSDKTGKLSFAKDQLTTPELYKEAMKAEGWYFNGKLMNDKAEECYNALLARGWDPWFKRFEITRNEEQLRNYERRLFGEYEDMLGAFVNEDKRYPNPSVYNCPGCPVAPICLALEDGSDAESVVELQFREGEDRKAEKLGI